MTKFDIGSYMEFINKINTRQNDWDTEQLYEHGDVPVMLWWKL